MLRGLIYFISTTIAVVLIYLGLRQLFFNYGDIQEHCNCTSKADNIDTVDINQFKILVDDSKIADFITTPNDLKLNVGPVVFDHGILTCCGLQYNKYDKDTTKYILAVLETVSKSDRAKIIDTKNDLEYDFEFKITKAFDHFKKSTECMDCSFGRSYRGNRTGFQHCSYSVACKNGDYSKAKFYFKDYYLKTISFE